MKYADEPDQVVEDCPFDLWHGLDWYCTRTKVKLWYIVLKRLEVVKKAEFITYI